MTKNKEVSPLLLSTESTNSTRSLMDSLHIPVPLPATNGPSVFIHEHRRLIFTALVLGNLFSYAQGAVYTAFMPLEAQFKGVRPSGIGWILSAHQLAMCVLAPCSGYMLTWMSPKKLLICGFVLVSACGVSFGSLHWTPDGNWYLLLALVIRFIEGIGDVIAKTASVATVFMLYSDNAPVKMGQYFISSGLGGVLGAFSGGFLVQLGDVYLPFFVFGSLKLVPVILILFVMSDVNHVPEKRSIKLSYAVFADGEIMLCFLGHLFAFVMGGFIQVTLELQISMFTTSPIILGLVFVIIGLSFSISTPLWGCLCQKFGWYEVMHIFGCCISCVGILLYGPAYFLPIRESFKAILLGAVLFEFSLGATVVLVFCRCLRNCTQRRFPNDLTTNGQVSALGSMGQCLGTFVGQLSGGYLYETVGMGRASVFVFAGEVAVIALLVIQFMWKLAHPISSSTSGEQDPLLSRT